MFARLNLCDIVLLTPHTLQLAKLKKPQTLPTTADKRIEHNIYSSFSQVSSASGSPTLRKDGCSGKWKR